jgi:DNA-binding NtrC family response regulator
VRQLHVVYSPGKPSSSILTLEPGTLPIGREPGTDTALRLDDGEVSRRHAEVIGSPRGWKIEDRGSRNGTIVDGVKHESAELLRGTVIRVGRTLMIFTDGTTGAGETLLRETTKLRGPSLAMQRLRGRLGGAAGSLAPLVIVGERGAGKEVVAREIHERAGRRGAFVPVGCAVLPNGEQERLLFGVAENRGLVGAADGGTLLLDEPATLPESVQKRIAGLLAAPADLRILFCTRAPIAEQAIVPELRAHLSEPIIDVPPLRERREDILWLARGFLDREGRRLELSAGAAEALLLYTWPENVRELATVIADAAARAAKTTILRAEHLPADIAKPVAARRAAAAEAAGRDVDEDQRTRRADD